MQSPTLLGVDSGGTFTDFVLLRDRQLITHKVLSTPEAPERAILQGIHDLGLSHQPIILVHGTTVATNAVLQGKGVSTAYITNRGFADVLTIGRQARSALYALELPSPEPPVSAERCFEIDTRRSADGNELRAITSAELNHLVERVVDSGVDAVAINLLFSFLSDAEEQRIAEQLPSHLFVSVSSRVLPQAKEYERGIATWLNASVGPLVKGYLARLSAELSQAAAKPSATMTPSSISIMQSSAGTIAAEQAAAKAVNLLLSGPAGGLVGARFIGSELGGAPQLLSFDMGGTSTDVALINGEIQLTSEGHIAGYPVAVPMVDMHTIGAGGGSIATIDSGGLLCVGPASAGALPGPACYGKGGTQATVSDANLLLGRLQANAFLGGSMRLDTDAAREALKPLSDQLGVSVEQAALGIIRIVDEHMARALRVMSVQRGIDPAQLTLISFGGAGALHVCSLAENLNMRKALIPVHAGVLSALGMLRAPKLRQLSFSINQYLLNVDVNGLMEHFARLEQIAADELVAEGVDREQLRFRRQADLRYVGQSYELSLDWENPPQLVDTFHLAHETRYGHRLDNPVQVVNLRVTAKSPALIIDLPRLTSDDNSEPRQQKPNQFVALHGVGDHVPLWWRRDLTRGQTLRGPALICETASTSYIAPNWTCQVDEWGNMQLRHLA